MYPPERQREIAALAQAAGRVEVTTLANHFQVAAETIRRDLSVLEQEGVVRKVHGGAVSTARIAFETPVSERQRLNPDDKAAIAQAALHQIPHRATVILDAGTTTARLASLIPHDSELTVITHSLTIANILANHQQLQLHVLGGLLRPRTHATTGAWAIQTLARLHADFVFLGANGVDDKAGFTTPDIAEAEVKRALVAAASRRIVLADASKIGHRELVTFAQIPEIDLLITGPNTATDSLRAIADTGIEVQQA